MESHQGEYSEWTDAWMNEEGQLALLLLPRCTPAARSQASSPPFPPNPPRPPLLLTSLSTISALLGQWVQTHKAFSSVSCLPAFIRREENWKGFQKSHLLVFIKTLSASHHKAFAVSDMCLPSLHCLRGRERTLHSPTAPGCGSWAADGVFI